MTLAQLEAEHIRRVLVRLCREHDQGGQDPRDFPLDSLAENERISDLSGFIMEQYCVPL